MEYLPNNKDESFLLRRVARMWDIQPGYVGPEGQAIWSTDRALLELLQSVTESKIESAEDLRELARRRKTEAFSRPLQPVMVCWGGVLKEIAVTVPIELVDNKVQAQIRLEEGTKRDWEWSLSEQSEQRQRHAAGKTFVRVKLPVLEKLPLGYHHLTLSVADNEYESLLISAPDHLPNDPTIAHLEHSWGTFAPLYALRTQRDWGIGSLAEMAEVQDYVHAQGGRWVGTLPLLATKFNHHGSDPSPYSPLSRLFWNEIYLDMNELVETIDSDQARALISESRFQQALEDARKTEQVDYDQVYQLKKDVLELLKVEFFKQGGEDTAEFQRFLKENPEAVEYSEYRGQDDERECNYHLFVQFQMNRQLKKLNKKFQEGKTAGIYLDYPVGVRRESFDMEKYKSSFVDHVSAGAPPDPLFEGGQNWGFFPFHPQKVREDRYEYFIKSVRNHVRYSQILRVDHVMGFHRIWAVPDGLGAKEGAYLRFNPQEFYAILCLEAYRCKTYIVGEDLGTVPYGVRETMALKGLKRMWVYQFECGGPKPEETFNRVPEKSLACLNTHDMPPFAGFWRGRDLEWMRQLQLIDDERIDELERDREALKSNWMKYFKSVSTEKDISEREAYRIIVEKVAASPAQLLLLNIEDLWQETESQNMPGTWKEYPNWTRKFRHAIEEWGDLPFLTQTIQRVNEIRHSTEKE